MEEFFMGSPEASLCLIQPIDEHDAALLQKEFEIITQSCGNDVCLAAFMVKSWNNDLSPWQAPPVFGDEDFGGKAKRTLHFILKDLLPRLDYKYCTDRSRRRYILGGYSLAALFSLWACYQTDRFAACAAASPSVWFPGWIDYAKANPMQTGTIYLSLGDREARTRNAVMASVADCIRQQAELLKDKTVTLEWNKGNHFKDSEKRTARAFSWCAEQL